MMKQDLGFHPLANLFPLMEGKEFDKLVEDIRKHGLQESITLYDGKILDGRNRYLACEKAGKPFVTLEYEGSDPLDLVVSLNLMRRHLTDSQRAMIADKIASLPKGANQHARIRATSQAEAAKKLNVSRTTIQVARKVREHGDKELTKKVERGELKLNKAVVQIADKYKQAEAPWTHHRVLLWPQRRVFGQQR